ncbi:hypothetical protein BDZ94DRAFT_1243126 [Collybia nuda]|uniref:SMP-LTD domain-containing protein n=1 Tax=Collybia nuda TaxID=64659 RepID=A0A9P5YLE7_9AGAR|nr:hypothetical protein BDZ94DRAFT_1243126 [Collybia nuda]
MGFKALFYAYVLGGFTLIPLVVVAAILFTVYTSVPVGDPDPAKASRGRLEREGEETEKATSDTDELQTESLETNDVPRTRKGWLTMRRTFEESNLDGGYVTLVRSFLDARSKDPKRSRPKDMWYVVLKGKVLYLYEDEEMTECEAAIELSGHDVVVFPEGLLDGELFAKRNAICLKPKPIQSDKSMPSATKQMKFETDDVDTKVERTGGSPGKQEKEREKSAEVGKRNEAARDEALNSSTPWYIFVRSNIEMEDWYFALIHASDHPAQTPTLTPLLAVFQPFDMNHLVATLDEQPDVIPMRWLNALIGRIFFSYYRTHNLEAYIIGRLMKKLSKVKRPAFLTDIVVTEVCVGNKAPTFSKPMLKELTKEGDASMEVHLQYKGEFRITIEATATINLGARFKSYTVKLVLAAVLKELEGNLLVKVKRPPSNRIWYAFTQTPRMVLEVEPIVSDRQITWGMILGTIESRLKEIIQESVVLPNMDDIAFFESSHYQHRGGIWQDASRHERQPSSISEQVVDETLSTASAPVPDAQLTPPITEESTSLSRSKSAEELSVDAPLITPSPPPMEEAATAPPRINNRRRSWFSSVRSEDAGSLSNKDFFIDGDVDSDSQRGRSTESDKAGATSPRSQSTPHKQDSNESSDQEDDYYLQTHLSPHSARRSSSHHSSREHVKSTSIDSSKSAPDPSTTTPSKSSNQSTPSSPNSFLSTLKSRAGDKQALSNTAKEAMRKWGVNWGGLRKDTNGGASGEDLSDHGSIGSSISARLRPDSSVGNTVQKARASYAEVRAAVAERKGRDRHSNSNSNTDEGGELSRSSSPVMVPEGSRGTQRVVSNPSIGLIPPGPSTLLFPEGAATPSSSPASSSRRLSTGDPSAATARKTSPSISRVNSESDPAPNPNHAPIQMQPQAKMMTIPGIHASHRGEVMSMGYVAPTPPPMVPTEGKSSIQSVYRLWKSPGTSQDQPQQDQPEPLSQTEPSNERDTQPATLGPVPSPPSQSSRPIPPPLPPRSTPVAVTRPPLEPLPSGSPPSATAALKSIADKDELTRATLEGGGSEGAGALSEPDLPRATTSALDLNAGSSSAAGGMMPLAGAPGPPPLPPRRIVPA